MSEENKNLEIQGYRMINDGNGSRLAERQEKEDFFDISVLRYDDDTGEIDPILEVEDILDGAEAENTLQEMITKYPDAIDCGWVN